jgi:hypothetical protein
MKKSQIRDKHPGSATLIGSGQYIWILKNQDGFGPPGSASGSISHKYGSGSGSSCDPAPDPSIIKQKNKKKFDFFLLLCDYFITFYVCPGSSFGSVEFVCFLGIPDPHPDSLVRGTDPRIRIRVRTVPTCHGSTRPRRSKQIFIKLISSQAGGENSSRHQRLPGDSRCSAC